MSRDSRDAELNRLRGELAEARQLLGKAGEAFDEGSDCIAGLRRELTEARGKLSRARELIASDCSAQVLLDFDALMKDGEP
jgi:hypothetical protein